MNSEYGRKVTSQLSYAQYMMAFCRYVRFSAKAIIGCAYLKNAQHAGTSNTSTTQDKILLNSKQNNYSLQHIITLYSS